MEPDDEGYKIVFTPSVAGEYSIEITLVDKNGLATPIKGSPFIIHVDLKPGTITCSDCYLYIYIYIIYIYFIEVVCTNICIYI